MATSQRASLLPGAENHRHGRVSGDDGLTKIVRTFHARFGSVKLGGSVTARERLAYVHREGKHAGDAADVEATAGDKEKVIEASDRIRDTARVRRGKTAERLLATQVIELPMESTAEQRQACADAFVVDWRGRGHQSVAVVHVHGEEHKQPHLHVEIAARPVHADGSVNRSATRLWAGGHPAVEVKKERARAADIVNRTCDPDPPYHPGGFRDIGVERQPRTRIPAGKFREAREEIRDARAADDTDGAARIEAKAYAVSDKERGEKRKARVGRTAEIIEFRAAGLPARPSQRARLAFAEPALKAERARAEKAEASVRELEAGQVEPLRLTDRQRGMLVGTCGRKHIDGDIGNDARVQLLAFAALHEEENARLRDFAARHEEERKALKKARDEAAAAGTAATTAEKELNELRPRAEVAEASVATLKTEKQQAERRAEKAERERDGLQDRVRALEELNKTQTKYVTNWHANRKVVLPNLATVEGQSAAWANMWAWDARALKKARDEAGAAVTAATTAEKERDEQRERAEKAEDRVPALEQRAGDAEVLVRELEARQVQPLPLNEKQREMLVGVCARKRIDGDPVHDARVQLLAFAAHHEERDKAREERKRREAEAKLELEAEKQEQNRDGRGTGEAGGAGRQPDQGADRPGTEARRGGGAEDHGAGRAERPRAGGDRPEGGPHAVDGNAGGDRGAASPAAREPGGVESRVVAAPDREDAEGLAREHRLVAESGGVETPADRSSDGDGAMVGDNGGGEWAWLLDVGDAGDGPGPRRPVVAEPPPDVVVSGAGKGGEAAPEPPPPARPWKDLSDDELVNHWDGASRRRRRAATDEQKADARQKIDELHAEAKHRNTTLKALDARKQQREGRGRGMEM